MISFVGVCTSFTVLAGHEWSSVMRMLDEGSGEPFEGMPVTFNGFVVTTDGAQVPISFSRTEGAAHTVVMAIPALPEGRWHYEVFATDETGDTLRMLWGEIEAEGESVEEDEVVDGRTFDVLVPGSAGQLIRLNWRKSGNASAAALRAEAAAAAIEGIRETATGALSTAQQALDALEGVEDAVEEATEVKENLEKLLEDAPREFVPTIDADGYWVINGEKQPHKATGTDGVDGTTIERIVVESVSDIPTSGETCHGGVYYYVPNGDGGYDCYAWAQDRWIKVDDEAESEANLPATASRRGTVLLGTDAKVEDGAPVGENAEGKMHVPAATMYTHGTLMLSYNGVVENGWPIGKDSAGRAVVYPGKLGDSMGALVASGSAVQWSGGKLTFKVDATSFEQSSSGLQLKTGTPTIKGGFYTETEAGSEREDAVYTAKQANELFASLARVEELLKLYMKVTPTTDAIAIMTREEFDGLSLTGYSPKTIYLVY